MFKRLRSASWIPAAALLGAACRADAPDHSAVGAGACVPPVPVRASPGPPDTLSAAGRCALVAAAWRAVADGPRLGALAASDTARIADATVFRLDELDPATDAVRRAQWLVHFRLRGAPLDAEVLIDAATGRPTRAAFSEVLEPRPAT